MFLRTENIRWNKTLSASPSVNNNIPSLFSFLRLIRRGTLLLRIHSKKHWWYPNTGLSVFFIFTPACLRNVTSYSRYKPQSPLPQAISPPPPLNRNIGTRWRRKDTFVYLHLNRKIHWNPLRHPFLIHFLSNYSGKRGCILVLDKYRTNVLHIKMRWISFWSLQLFSFREILWFCISQRRMMF